MISVTGVTGNYILSPALLEKHKQTIDWLSSSMLWKSELTFFQKVLDEKAPFFDTLEDKKKIDHFQNLTIYYNGEVIDNLRKGLRNHESRLASMLGSKNELDTQYYKEHDAIMDQLETFSKLFKQFRIEFLGFIEKSSHVN